MNEHLSLFDDYLEGTLDADGLARLEASLAADAELRRAFVRYCHLHTELHFESRARRAESRVLAQIESSRRFPRWLIAASLLFAAGVAAWAVGYSRSPAEEVAWLVNAQNVRWPDGQEPTGPLVASSELRFDGGLTEFRFRSGAVMIVEGPAALELLTGNSARMTRGKLTAKVPESAKGFTIIAPNGKVIDFGTEFGVAINDDGSTLVEVFKGEVDAISSNESRRLTDHDSVLLTADVIRATRPTPDRFTRLIVPPPVIIPRTKSIDFRAEVPYSLLDVNGRGIGLTARLPGTGAKLGERDANLKLNSDAGILELTTTDSDINTQFRMPTGEYLGVRLSELGFTGVEDFAVSAVFPNFPPLDAINQFGLYAGTRSDRNIRGGIFSPKPGVYTQNIVNNNGGKDADSHFVGLLSQGDSVQVTLRRLNGTFSMTVENLTTGGTTTLTTKPPAFLDGERDLYVGLFGANTRSKESKTLAVSKFTATVWTVNATH